MHIKLLAIMGKLGGLMHDIRAGHLSDDDIVKRLESIGWSLSVCVEMSASGS